MEPWGPQTTGKPSQSPGADYLGVISRHRWLVILVVGWAIGLAALYSFTRPTLYTAEAAVQVGPGITSLDSGQTDVNPETESQIVESTAVAERAEELVAGDQSVASLLRKVSVDVPENTEILSILFSADTPVQAKDGANAFADAYLDYRLEQATSEVTERVEGYQEQLQEIEPLIDEARAQREAFEPGDPQYATLSDEINSLTAQRSILLAQLLDWQSRSINPGQVIASALTPPSPSSPNHTLDLALGLIVGLGLAFGLAYIRDRKSTGFESPHELEEVLGVPVMAVIPSFRDERISARDPIALYGSGGPISDGYRTLRAAVLARAERSRLVTIAVTSARSGEGKSMTAAMLAIALASTGRRVVLIDGDLRRPMVSKLGIDDRLGLADVLAGRVDSVLDTMQTTAIDGLSVVASGRAGPSSDPAELLQSDRMRKVLEDCGFADFVVLDTPAVLAVADALVLAPLTDGVLFVASAKDTTTQALDYGMLQLQRIGADIIGSVLIGVRRPEGQELGYYYRLDRPGVRINPLGKAPEADPGNVVGRSSASRTEPVLHDRETPRVDDPSFLDDVEAIPGPEDGRSADPRRGGSPQPGPTDERADPDSRLGVSAVSPSRVSASDPGAADTANMTPPLPAPPPRRDPAATSASSRSSSRADTRKRPRAKKARAKPSSSQQHPEVTASEPDRTSEGSTTRESADARARSVPDSGRERSMTDTSLETSAGEDVEHEAGGHDAVRTSADKDADRGADAEPERAEPAIEKTGSTPKPAARSEPAAQPNSSSADSGEAPPSKSKGSFEAGHASHGARSKKKGGDEPRSRTTPNREGEDFHGTVSGADAGDESASEGGSTT